MSIITPPTSGTTRLRVAEEVRAWMGRRRLSGSRLANLSGISQSRLSRRLTGEFPFDLDELDVVADVLGVPVAVFFRTDESPHPDNPGGGVVHRQGLEPRTRWLRAVRDEDQAPGTPFLPSEKGYDSPWPNVAKAIQPLIPANASYETKPVVQAGHLSERVGA